MRTGLVAAALVVAVLAAGCDDDGDDAASCDFDPAEWAGLDPADDDEGARKGELADVVVDCGLLDDATRAETAELLGEGGAADAARWEYSTQPTMIDFELLVVDFGADDTVTRVHFGQS
ncbi:hypothetical protein [Jiangella sp. DSM 45060]|uniref:hypothetical protein n=1 Tax=Jiangella sp. DSM 45060 TaxID=1798224 RepID=UPI00087BBF26|nr:hypothetical protein [Jiangella sp. DSM 45060]SDT00425.1 hypothetical protein SAMN04515669_2509 [Jiangella sp. DSM 45060]